ncbi:MAG: hypothetical protein J0I20_26140 [Chloroflexi bacterium]|nr:hypothetical protein [Chloroflexota bacterium]
MLEIFDFYISYSQLIIFDNELEAPFNDWRPEHVAQGFSWREGSVSFRTLEDNGSMRVEWLKPPILR